jgi:hypothetical protein
VAVHPIPATAFVTPVPIDPRGVPAWRLDPVARNPGVAAAVPALMTANPGPARMRPWARMFNDDRRRTDTDIDSLRKR